MELINEKYKKRTTQEKLSQAFSKAKPFPYCVLPEFMDEMFLASVRDELTQEEFFPKSNDLYDFFQTEDLKLATTPALMRLKDTLYGKEFLKFMETVSGCKLTSKVDMAGLLFPQGGNLLCHDDELEGRRIAYILYMVSDWEKGDGGTLDFYSVDNHLEPAKVVHSFVPQWNTFLFFEVRPESFHQVSEILADKERISISGWFHGTPLKREKEPPLEILSTKPISSEGVDLKQWIHPQYLKPAVIQQIRAHFDGNASVELQQFLLEKQFAHIQSALSEQKWSQKGPANRRQYSISLPSGVLAKFEQLLTSTEFAQYLKQLTGFSPQYYASELRRFSHSDYTLLHDRVAHQSGLDAYFFSHPHWKEEMGGVLTYLDGDEELVTLIPHENSFALVMRNKGVQRFVKYLNAQAESPRYEFSLTYLDTSAK